MAIELHHLHPSHDDEQTRLKARIAELVLHGGMCKMKNDKHYYKVKKNVNLPEGANRIIYRVWWMVLVNLILKIVQPFTKDPFLLNVISDIDDNGNPHFEGYAFERTHFCDGYFERIKGSLFSGRYAEKFYTDVDV